ncbi:MAG: hypothetical protein LUH23_09925 [Oscillospiraceae bacterium]|nr:hypothetical protein [Oscillospiraceae bacterium]
MIEVNYNDPIELMGVGYEVLVNALGEENAMAFLKQLEEDGTVNGKPKLTVEEAMAMVEEYRKRKSAT